MSGVVIATRSDGIRQSKAAQQELLEAGNQFRNQHPWLFKYQDSIGLGIFGISILAILAGGTAYALGLIPAWLTIVNAAVWMSLLHELEHDLIHLMYFRKHPFWNNLMMAGVWLFRPSTISPWVRKKMHLHHHKFSGTESDIEERGITNGEPWGIKRLLMVGDHMLSIYLRPFTTLKMVSAYIQARQPKDDAEKREMFMENATGYFPLGIIHYTLWHGLILWTVVSTGYAIAGAPVELSGFALKLESVVHFLAVTLLIPNVLRVFCLHFVSSNMHYYGDVEPGNIIQQTQVWNAWWLFPLHAFCFNFGATHAIHHFVVRDPFYVRQMTAHRMYPILQKYGVRFNDFGTLLRANRLGQPSTLPKPASETLPALGHTNPVA